MERVAVISFSEAQEHKIHLLLAKRNLNTRKVIVEAEKELVCGQKQWLGVGMVDIISGDIKTILKDTEWEGRLFYVAIPDSLVAYKCFTRTLANTPNLKKKSEAENFKRQCLQENPDKKRAQEYAITLAGISKDEQGSHYTCAYVSAPFVATMELAFAKAQIPVLALEANYYGLQRVARLLCKQRPFAFSHRGNYFLSERENIFHLYSAAEDPFTNFQVLMALRQKAFMNRLNKDDISFIKVDDLEKLPQWICAPNITNDYLSLCSIGTVLRGIKDNTFTKETGYGFEKLREFFKH